MRNRLFILVIAGLITPTLFANAQQSRINKVPIQRTAATSGQEMYSSYCAACHGAQGKGNGPAARALTTVPVNLTRLAENGGGRFPSSRVASVLRFGSVLPAHGSRDMPVWGPLFHSLSITNPSEEQQRISNLTRYVQTMQIK